MHISRKHGLRGVSIKVDFRLKFKNKFKNEIQNKYVLYAHRWADGRVICRHWAHVFFSGVLIIELIFKAIAQNGEF